MELKPSKPAAVFMPRTMGVFILLIIVLSFAAGAIRQEMVLTLTGAVFLAIWVYSLVMTLLLALLYSRRAVRVSFRLSPEKIVAGGWTQVIFSPSWENSPNGKIFQFPGILVRCRVLLGTRDGRRIMYDFKPEYKTGVEQQLTFQAKKRGAYFSAYDEFAIFDILGYFRFAFRIPAGNGVRLLVSPHGSCEPVPVMAKGGESERQDAPAVERTDDLIDHRPYVPGDDPRRINWKLYSHGGELFIRQGEREPPPHSNITILIDTQFDLLYRTGIFARGYAGKSANAGSASAVDLLCENALAIINSAGKDRDIQIGFTGQTEENGSSLTQAELGFFLAYPAALSSGFTMYPYAPLSVKKHKQPVYDDMPNEDLPPVPENRAILILAMPRLSAQPSALDRFLSNNANRTMELIFIYGSAGNDERVYEERAAAAETCVRLYNNRPGVRARAVGVR